MIGSRVRHAGDDDARSVKSKSAAQVESGGRPDWGDQALEDEQEAQAANDQDGEEAGGEESPPPPQQQQPPIKVKKEAFDVPMQGPFYLHDDRFDEAEAQAHEE